MRISKKVKLPGDLSISMREITKIRAPEVIRGQDSFLEYWKLSDADLEPLFYVDPNILNKEKHKISAAQIMRLRRPFQIHNDVGYSSSSKEKSVLAWSLSEDTLEPDNNGVIFFKQRSEKSILIGDGYFNREKAIVENDEKKKMIHQFTNELFNDDKYRSHLEHVNYGDLFGLNVDSVEYYEKNLAIYFDARQLHCSMCFKSDTKEIVSIFIEQY